MPGRHKLDAEAARLWDAMSAPSIAFPERRKSGIVSAYHFYRLTFGSVLVSDHLLRTYLSDLFVDKGPARGYAIAIHLRDAFGVFWGTDAAARITRIVRDIQPRVTTELQSEWDSALTPIARLPSEWREPFVEHLEKCRKRALPPLSQLSASTLKTYAESFCRWHRFRKGETSRLLTGSELRIFALILASERVAPPGVLAAASNVYSTYRHIISPGFSSDACRFVLRDLKGTAIAAGANKKTASQIVSAQLIYTTGLRIMEDVMSKPHHDISSAKAYRDGLLLAVAASLPLRRRTLASLDTASSFRLENPSIFQIDISGNFLKLREHRKIVERFQATFINPRLWRAVDLWAREVRPIFDDGTSLFPSARVRGEALVPGILSQVFGDVTEAHLGVRVPIHRVRDCVATECVEEMENGAAWAPYLLNHKSAETTNEYYVHASGVKATREFASLLKQKRTNPSDLLI
jgi:hypothetical protein